MNWLCFNHLHILRRLNWAIVPLILIGTYYELSCLIFHNLDIYASCRWIFVPLAAYIIIHVTLQSVVCLFYIKVVFVKSFHSSLTISFHLSYWLLKRFDYEGRHAICKVIVRLLMLSKSYSCSFGDIDEELVFLFFLLLKVFIRLLLTIFVFIDLDSLQGLQHIDYVPSLSRWWLLQSSVSRWQSRCPVSCRRCTLPRCLYWLLFW